MTSLHWNTHYDITECMNGLCIFERKIALLKGVLQHWFPNTNKKKKQGLWVAVCGANPEIMSKNHQLGIRNVKKMLLIYVGLKLCHCDGYDTYNTVWYISNEIDHHLGVANGLVPMGARTFVVPKLSITWRMKMRNHIYLKSVDVVSSARYVWVSGPTPSEDYPLAVWNKILVRDIFWIVQFS